jgi:plastocyanin
MRHIISGLAALALLVSLVLGTAQVLAQADDSGGQVNIVEPDFQPPQAWTYDPNDLTVQAGTTITWSNTGAVAHTVTADDGVSFDSGNLDPQATFSLTPTSPGTFTYHCTFHPWMTGSFTVTT